MPPLFLARPAFVPLRRRLMQGAVMLPVALTLVLAGCAKPVTDPTVTGAIAHPISQDDFEKATAYWGERYQQDDKSRDVALNYAVSLQRTNRADQAVAVLQKTTLRFPNDRDVLAAYGKSLAANGDLQQALQMVQRAQTPDKPDWRLMSAEGAILDQLGNDVAAQQLYVKALGFAPGEPTILSNYAMSYVMTGKLAEAEKLLRQALAAPTADSRVRQNLALVVGLSGRFAEAEKIAGAEMSPDQAAANVAYLKQMLNQPDSWQKLKAKQTG